MVYANPGSSSFVSKNKLTEMVTPNRSLFRYPYLMFFFILYSKLTFPFNLIRKVFMLVIYCSHAI